MVLDRPLAVGADGGHGPIRYRVVEYEPGRRVRFVFHPATGISGIHELAVEALGEDRCRMRHVLLGRARGAMRALFPLVVEPLHDAVIEDLLDNAERCTTPSSRICWTTPSARLPAGCGAPPGTRPGSGCGRAWSGALGPGADRGGGEPAPPPARRTARTALVTGPPDGVGCERLGARSQSTMP